jgi:hypothetical protein
MDFYLLHLLLVKALEQLRRMDILHSRLTFSKMVEWTHKLPGINYHSNILPGTMNSYGANYQKRCGVQTVNIQNSKCLKRLSNQLLKLGVEKHARNEG